MVLFDSCTKFSFQKFGGRRSAVLRKNKLIIVIVLALIFFCIAKTFSDMWYSRTVTATGTLTGIG